MSIQKYFQKTGTLAAAAILLWSFVIVPTQAQSAPELSPESTEAEAVLPESGEVVPSVESEYIQLVVDYEVGTRVEKVLDNLEGEEFTSVTIESNYPIGEDTMTDFIIKKPEDDLTNLSAELIAYRNDFLTTLEVAPSEVGETVEGEKYTKEEIKKAQKETDFIDPKAKQVKVLMKKDKEPKIKNKLSRDRKVKEIKITEVKPVKKSEAEAAEKEEKSKNRTSLFENPLKDYFAGVKTEAQSYPDWVPDYTSVSFFDTDEVGAWVYNDWQSPGGQTPSSLSITHGNGSMFVAHRGSNNRIYVGKWNSNGDNFLGWGEVPGARTDAAPAIEYYYGRVYLVHKGQNNRMYVNYTTNEGGSWTGYQELPGDTVRALDVEKLGNSLYIVHRGGDGTPYLSRMDNGSNNWGGWQGLRGRYTDEKITLAANGNTRMYMGMKERGTQGAIVNLDVTSFSANNWRVIRGYTRGSFGIVDVGPKTCFQIRDINLELLQGCNESSNLNGDTYFVRSQQRSAADPVIDKDWNLMQVATNLNGNIIFRRLGFNTNTRGYISEMIWNNAPFGNNSTYEQEIYLYNYSPYTSLYVPDDSTANPECMPLPLYYTSNLPDYYLDTRLDQDGLCDSDKPEPSYTIGSGNADAIFSNDVYYTYWVDTKGGAAKPLFKLQHQLGFQSPPGCTSTWCSFGFDNPEANQRTIPFDLTGQDRSNTYPYWQRSFNK